MSKNLRTWNRLFRYGLGMMLLTWAFLEGPSWAFIGFYPLASGAWGFCPIYFFIQTW